MNLYFHFINTMSIQASVFFLFLQESCQYRVGGIEGGQNGSEVRGEKSDDAFRVLNCKFLLFLKFSEVNSSHNHVIEFLIVKLHSNLQTQLNFSWFE